MPPDDVGFAMRHGATMPDDLPKLTTKQRRFVEAYCGEARFNASEAARIAGYSDAGQSGWELKKKPEVLAHIEARLNSYAASSAEALTELADVAMSEWRDHVTVRKNPKTGETIEVRMDLSAKVKALELILKAHGAFAENVNIKHSGRVDHVHRNPDLKHLSDDELDALERIAQRVQDRDAV